MMYTGTKIYISHKMVIYVSKVINIHASKWERELIFPEVSE